MKIERHIAVVAHELEGERTGVGRYLEGLLRGLLDDRPPGRRPPWKWHLYFRGDPFAHALWPDPSAPPESFQLHFDGRASMKTILWEQLRLPRLLRREPLDAVFSPSYSLPPRLPAPGLVTIHDLSFEHLPEEFSWKERWRRRLLARSAARRAARVLSDTRTIARELEATYRFPPQRSAVVPLAVDADVLTGREEDDEDRLRELGLQRPFLLYLGSLLPRRNVVRMIEVFAEIAKEYPELRLVLAGPDRLRDPERLNRAVDSSGCAERIVRLGYVPENALGALYRRAELSFYLSDYEGYGLPPLESLAARTPPIVGPGLALDDLWPEYPYRCADFEIATVADAVRRALGDAEERRRVGEEGAERVAALTWTAAAERLCEEISAVCAEAAETNT